MIVEIELFGGLSPALPRRQTLTPERAMTIAEIGEWIGLIPDHVGLIVLNGVQSEWEDAVTTNGRLCFFPPVSGG